MTISQMDAAVRVKQGSQLIFNPNATPGHNVFDDFNDLYETFQGSTGWVEVWFPEDCALSAKTGGGAYDLENRVKFSGPQNLLNVVVNLDPGVQFTNFHHLETIDIVGNDPTDPAWLLPDDEALVLDIGARIRSAIGAVPVVRSTGAINGGVIISRLGGTIVKVGGAIPVEIASGAKLLVFSLDFSGIDDDVFSGDGTTTLVIVVGDTLISLGGSQPSFGGTAAFLRGSDSQLVGFTANEPTDWETPPTAVSGALDELAERERKQQGLATLVAGTVTVSTAKIRTNSFIIPIRESSIGTIGDLSIANQTPGDPGSFDINSSNAADLSKIRWVVLG